MNNINNMLHAGQSKTSGPTFSSGTNTSLEQSGGARIDDSSARPATFDASMKKAFNESLPSDADVDTNIDAENNGNKLPLVEDSTELPAQDDRSKIIDSLNTASLLPAENKLLAQNAVEELQLSSPDVDADSQFADELTQTSSLDAVSDDSAVDGKLSILLSQVRQHLRMEQNIDGKNSQTNQLATISGELNTNRSVITSATHQASDTLPLNSEQVDLMAAKNQNLSNTANQQSLATLQTLLLQTVSAQGEPILDSSPLVTNTMTNNLMSPSLASLPQAEITEAFGRPVWDQGMGKQILWMVNQNISSAEIRLNPAHLGPIEILIDMSDDKVNVSLSSHHAIVREAMEQALPKLREMLSENGFNLADTDISKHSFAEQREQDTNNSNSRVKSNHNNHSNDNEMGGSIMSLTSSIAKGLVDYYI